LGETALFVWSLDTAKATSENKEGVFGDSKKLLRKCVRVHIARYLPQRLSLLGKELSSEKAEIHCYCCLNTL
jgi:hypothetical protein